MKRLTLHIKGIVQGVGFRPFVYHIARQLELVGFVLNHSQGVQVEVEGSDERLEDFLDQLQHNPPPLAVIDEVLVVSCPLQGEQEFSIKYSTEQAVKRAWVSPDVGMCLACEQEVKNPADRRYGYAFTNCTHCGPRYSIIKDVPYDRVATTMADFPMCKACQAEYDDPEDRRFHAQPNACAFCGPHYHLRSVAGELTYDDVFNKARHLVARGKILAVKGIGGYHLVCDAYNEQAVTELRSRKIREDKPFAVMCGSLQAVYRLCDVSEREEQLLTSTARPIVLLKKKTTCPLAASIAPSNPYLGVMLPYAPVHVLLLQPDDVWVMTSANVSDEPIVYEDQEAVDRLSGIADSFLIHNRMIYRPSDDSVVRVLMDKQSVLRRSRGFAPTPLKLSRDNPSILAVGAEVKNAFCLTQGHFAFMSSHIGDLENLVTYESYLASIVHYQKLFDIQPELVAYDLHPEYLATKYALSLPTRKIGVQHHHAHIASVLAEHSLSEPVIGVAFDGTGYGSDGALWGGEFLIVDGCAYTRAGHCQYIALPGGALAIKEPWRLAAWVLYNIYGNEFANLNIDLTRQLPRGWQLMMDATGKGLNAPLSSSAGRLFDIAAGILGIGSVIHYEGQAAVELELSAQDLRGQVLPYAISNEHPRILDFMPTFAAMAEAFVQGENKNFLAASFHATVAHAVVDMVRCISHDTGVTTVALSGGVWQNRLLFTQVVGMLQQEGYRVYSNQQVPLNDGGIALGQAFVAGLQRMER